jgi:hypothetical protein
VQRVIRGTAIVALMVGSFAVVGQPAPAFAAVTDTFENLQISCTSKTACSADFEITSAVGISSIYFTWSMLQGCNDLGYDPPFTSTRTLLTTVDGVHVWRYHTQVNSANDANYFTAFAGGTVYFSNGIEKSAYGEADKLDNCPLKVT